ncbi:MAG: hypothetical protein ACLSH3_15755 [Alistipes finegoldii]
MLPADERPAAETHQRVQRWQIPLFVLGITRASPSEQFRAFAPEVLDSFKELAATGCVEFLAETYSHSLWPRPGFERGFPGTGETAHRASIKRSSAWKLPVAFLAACRSWILLRTRSARWWPAWASRTVLWPRAPSHGAGLEIAQLRLTPAPSTKSWRLLLRNHKLPRTTSGAPLLETRAGTSGR